MAILRRWCPSCCCCFPDPDETKSELEQGNETLSGLSSSSEDDRPTKESKPSEKRSPKSDLVPGNDRSSGSSSSSGYDRPTEESKPSEKASPKTPDRPSPEPQTKPKQSPEPPSMPKPRERASPEPQPMVKPPELLYRVLKPPSSPSIVKPAQAIPDTTSPPRLKLPSSTLPPAKRPQPVPTATTIGPMFSGKNDSKERSPTHVMQKQYPSTPPQRKPVHLILENFKDVESFYTIGRELGRGKYGITYICTEKSSRVQYACKSIFKWKLVNANDKQNIGREIQIMKRLKGNPNIVELKEVDEDMQFVHVIMELYTVGAIFYRIIDQGRYSESTAATICRQVVNAVDARHCNCIMHGDLKPEDFLFASKDDGALLKLTDFTSSILIEEGKKYQPMVGSANYVAPEVLQGRYGKEMDVWSAGVILYILLAGVPPFRDETEKGTLNSILQGHIDLEMKPWAYISTSAVDLVKKMLTKDPTRRITSARVLQHPWIRENGEAPNNPIDVAVTARMNQFRAMSEFKKLAPEVIAENLSEEQIKRLKVIFAHMDHNKRGIITYDELRKGMSQFRSQKLETKLKWLISAAEIGGNGTIDHNEFITTTLHRQKLERDYNLYKAFCAFDKDKCRFITREELDRAINGYGMGDQSTIKEKLAKVETDEYGRIKYEEICSMMITVSKNPE